ncbi:MAG TPA: efflux RND transporter periplasmic adaptor subunit [Rhizomicrobium sp.]|nr:efflux RND transporter periplasmic adaptor subunit [Terriglobales bacterium]HWU54577.1 efflux RND transporter periplasmic adaptor subunit [Rhizomicrobium sp.]
MAPIVILIMTILGVLMSRFAVPALAFGLVLAACGRPQQQQQMPPASVGTITIAEQPVQLIAELPGRTNPFAVSEIRPQISGIVQKRLFVEGSTVKQGQPLYQIDPAPYQAAYDNAVATLASTKAKAERYARLLTEHAIAPQDADDARAAYLQAKANTDAARINLNYTRITAPITGRISASSVTEGALVTAQQATALATVSTLNPIYVDVDQSSAELVALKRAMQAGRVHSDGPLTAEVALKLDDGSTYPLKGKLQMTDVTVDPATGSVRLRAIFPNPQDLLLPGLYVRATINEGIDPHGILVPQNAIGHNQKGEPTTLVVDEKNFARLRLLKTGRAVDGNWQVLDGLKAGDKVITEGLAKVMPDMPVNASPAGQAVKQASQQAPAAH